MSSMLGKKGLAINANVQALSDEQLLQALTDGRNAKIRAPGLSVLNEDDINAIIMRSGNSNYYHIPELSDLSNIGRLSVDNKTFVIGPNCILPKKMDGAIVGGNCTIPANYSGSSIVFKGIVKAKITPNMEGKLNFVKLNNCVVDSVHAANSIVLLDLSAVDDIDAKSVKFNGSIANQVVVTNKIILAGNSCILKCAMANDGIDIKGHDNTIAGTVDAITKVSVEPDTFNNRVISGKLSNQTMNLINDSRKHMYGQNVENPSALLLNSNSQINHQLRQGLAVEHDMHVFNWENGLNMNFDNKLENSGSLSM